MTEKGSFTVKITEKDAGFPDARLALSCAAGKQYTSLLSATLTVMSVISECYKNILGKKIIT